MEYNSQEVAEGKLLSKTTYLRRPERWKELDLGSLKIDHYDPRTNTVREVKKSPKLEHAHVAQVKYYLYALEQHGIKGASGIIEYPKQRQSKEVCPLTDDDRGNVQVWEAEIKRIVELEKCPPLVRKGICRTCSFRDFCFV